MRQTKLQYGKSRWTRIGPLGAAALFLTACLPAASRAQEKGQKTFSSAEDAAKALATAAGGNDEKALLEILGPGGKRIISSGDAVEDAENHANFAKQYQEMHRLVREPDGTTTLYVGAKNWPAPIPLENKGNVWFFDTAAGEREILYRRIGRNEISTIHVSEELAAAQKEYYSTQGQQYAQQIFSDEGQHNGLYWKASEGEPQSPIGPLVAEAVSEGYDKGKAGPPTPYRGYLYHVLSSQGKDAPGGAKDYIVDGKMTGGFAFVAFPAEYRASGVMTFMVGPDGVVYQKDLGRKTAEMCHTMKVYNPDSTWQKVEDQGQQTASEQQPQK